MPFAIAIILALTFGHRVSAQALTISVRDTAGRPIPQVALTLIDSSGDARATARTGATGIAHLPRADTGAFRVFARRFGFRPRQTEYLRISATDTIAIRLTLERVATVMDPVLILAQRDSVRSNRNPFGINLRATGGHIVTPSEIDFAMLGARDAADMLARRALPGLIIDQVKRCPRSNRGGGCLPFVIDGQLFTDGSAMQDVVVPEMIDYMVILRGSEVGVRYGSIGYNGIVLIATKRDFVRRMP